MNNAELYFWSTVSQVAPVLGLALAIEARTMARNWGPAHTVVYRRVTIATWLTAAAGLAYAMPAAVIALRKNEAPSSLQEQLSSLALTYTFGLLIVSPLVELALFSNPGVWSWVLRSSPSLTWVIWRSRRQQQRLMRSVRRARATCFVMVGLSRKRLLLIESGQLILDRQALGSDPGAVTEVSREALQKACADHVSYQQQWRGLVRQELNLQAYGRAFDHLIRDRRQILREVSRAQAVALSAQWMDGSSRFVPSVSEELPDDGGFFSPSTTARTAIRNPDEFDRIVLDYRDFLKPGDFAR